MNGKRKPTGKLPDERPPLTDADGEVRELTEEDFRHMRPMTEMFPEVVKAMERVRGQRGPQKAPVKERVGLRLDRHIVDHFRATGKGWQTRINAVLDDYVKENRK